MADQGLQVPLEITERGIVLDGHARMRRPRETVSDLLAIPLPPELLERLVDAVAARVLDRLALQADHVGWPRWMSVLTAARYLDVSEERIRKLVARREIPYSQHDAGCRIFFDRLAIDEWMRGQTHYARNRR